MIHLDGTVPPLLLAQSNEPSNTPFALPGQESGVAGESAPGGTGGPGGAAGAPAGNPPQLFFIVLLVIGGIIIFSMFAQRRDRKKREVMLTTLKKHDKVQTIGGMIGSIVEVKKDSVVLKVDESSNTRITFSRSAIQQVLNGPEAGAVPTATAIPAEKA